MQRRHFLKVGVAGIASIAMPAVSPAEEAKGFRRLLILVELKGGNDALNTVVPYADPAYYTLRPRIAVKSDDVIRLDERTGLHPALGSLAALWKAKELAIVQGVGYAQPNLSHFRSIEIWDTASKSDETLVDGWLGRVFAATPVPAGFAADGVVVGSSDLGPLAGPRTRALALNETDQFLRQAKLAVAGGRGANAALNHILRVQENIQQAAAHLNPNMTFRTGFPKNPFGNAVRTAANLAANKSGIGVIRLSLNGFDTHQNQAPLHQRLLTDLA
jgi:uncharacterized protein (DUF1501 family)